MFRFHYLFTVALLALKASAAAAQTYPASPYPSAFSAAPASDADALASELLVLSADPTNLYALINAARLSLTVGDTDGAAALYTRAERVSPGNSQVKAGMARLLVNAQRPGEALRLFQDAAAAGAGLRDFGADRALAYDLVGEQERAQREYRALLKQEPDDETTRRYALSLGISGLKEPALALLEPLNRRGDRGAWRARAFVLAMNGERAEAERIAVTMMPPGMADGLRPFFDRLPGLSPTGRAFAIHFGEVRTNAARVADAQRIPALAALSPEPNPFPPARVAVQVAAVEHGKKSKRDKRAGEVRIAAQPDTVSLPPPPAPTAVQLAALNASGPPPAGFMTRPASSRGVTILPPPPDAYRPRDTSLAAATVPKAPADDESGDDEPDTAAPPPVAIRPPAVARVAEPSPPAVTIATAPPVRIATIAPAPAGPAQPPGATVPLPSIGGSALAATATLPPAAFSLAAPPPAESAGTPPPPTGASGDVVLASIAAKTEAPPRAAAAEPAAIGAAKLLTTVERNTETRAAVREAKTVAAEKAKPDLPPRDRRGRYVDAVGKPLLDKRGRPLDAKAAAAWQSAQVADPKPAGKLPPKDRRGRYLDADGKPLLDKRGRPLDASAAVAWQLANANTGETKATVGKLPKKDRRGRFVDADGKLLLDKRGRPLDAKAAAAWQLANAEADNPAAKTKLDAKLPPKDKRGRFVDADGKPLLDKRGRPLDAKGAAAWKLADAKDERDSKKAATKGEPQRIWVQVAGGANEDTLGKAWAKVSGETAALKGRQGWTTPLRATNRVLTGPFKTSAEAMALVNKLKGQGVAAFMFTSDAGQKVTRLGAK